MLDPERMYQHAQTGDWAEGLALVHRHPESVDREAPVRRAVETFEDAFFAQMNGRVESESAADCLETWLLLHSGGFYRLSAERFEDVVRRLVGWHRAEGQLDRAAQVARFAPELDICAEVLAADVNSIDEDPSTTPTPLAHEQSDTIRLSVNTLRPAGDDHTVSLFKSPQEEEFFRAAREAFPMYTPYPNVALSSLIDFEAIREALSAAERTFFFKGIVDCVIFDQHQAYRPLYFFEIDSAHHDAPDRQEKDRYKDRILAVAGHRLHRIRPQSTEVGQAAFARLLRDVFG